MSEITPLKEEIIEKEAEFEYHQKFFDEENIRTHLMQANLGYIQLNTEQFEKELEKLTLERVELQEKWLRSKVESAKARKDFDSKTDPKFYELESFFHIYSKAISKAEEELERHLKKCNKT